MKTGEIIGIAVGSAILGGAIVYGINQVKKEKYSNAIGKSMGPAGCEFPPMPPNLPYAGDLPLGISSYISELQSIAFSARQKYTKCCQSLNNPAARV